MDVAGSLVGSLVAVADKLGAVDWVSGVPSELPHATATSPTMESAASS